MIGIGLSGASKPLCRCPCCYSLKERVVPPPPPGSPPIPCAECASGGCVARYAGYWKHGEGCPRKAKLRKAARVGNEARAENRRKAKEEWK